MPQTTNLCTLKELGGWGAGKFISIKLLQKKIEIGGRIKRTLPHGHVNPGGRVYRLSGDTLFTISGSFQ